MTDSPVRKVFPFCNRLGNVDRSPVLPPKERENKTRSQSKKGYIVLVGHLGEACHEGLPASNPGSLYSQATRGCGVQGQSGFGAVFSASCGPGVYCLEFGWWCLTGAFPVRLESLLAAVFSGRRISGL